MEEQNRTEQNKQQNRKEQAIAIICEFLKVNDRYTVLSYNFVMGRDIECHL